MKSYYKTRPQQGETYVSFDMRTPSGVVADGHLTFNNGDGEPFVATYEATSIATSGEVRYTLQKQLLLWDGIAVGSFLSTMILTFLWAYKFWVSDSVLTYILFFLALMALLSYLYQFLFAGTPRYRYIYAIEQFKQYFANEQWVAIGSDVFPNPQDVYFVELKNQCVKNGFGLVQVEKDESIQLLITPAREEVFESQRKMLQFVSNNSVSSRPSLQVSAGVTSVSSVNPLDYQRYRKPVLTQTMIGLASAVILTGLAFKQTQDTAIRFQSPKEKAELMKKSRMDATDMNYDTIPSDNMSEKVDNGSDLASKSGASAYDASVLPADNGYVENTKTPDVYVYTMEGYVYYPCERVLLGTQYAIQDWVCNNFEDAKKRIQFLKSRGFSASCISLKCSRTASSKGYVVFHEFLFEDKTAANHKALAIKAELAKKKMPSDFIKLRTLNGE
jgi:hypothetical protein